jgi:hypothetical protein
MVVHVLLYSKRQQKEVTETQKAERDLRFENRELGLLRFPTAGPSLSKDNNCSLRASVRVDRQASILGEVVCFPLLAACSGESKEDGHQQQEPATHSRRADMLYFAADRIRKRQATHACNDKRIQKKKLA